MLDLNAHKKTHENYCICPVCKGAKTIDRKVLEGDREGYIEKEPCGFCKAQGILKRKVTIELTTI